jgi:hypothetical protein
MCSLFFLVLNNKADERRRGSGRGTPTHPCTSLLIGRKGQLLMAFFQIAATFSTLSYAWMIKLEAAEV